MSITYNAKQKGGQVTKQPIIVVKNAINYCN